MSDVTTSHGLGSVFPGAQGENILWAEDQIRQILERWRQDREVRIVAAEGGVRAGESAAAAEQSRSKIIQALQGLATRLRQETPTYLTDYIAHMKSDISLPALLGWVTALLYNANVSSAEVSAAGAAIETEAIGGLAKMMGFDPERARGHFTSGGTVANFEAMWRARFRMDHWLSLALYISEKTGEPLDPFAAAHMGWNKYRALLNEHECTEAELRSCSAVAGNAPSVHSRIQKASGKPWLGPVVLVPGHRHYSWQKAANLLGLGEEAFKLIALDDAGRMNLCALKREIADARMNGRPIMMVVTVAGSTEGGQVDPIDDVFTYLDELRINEGIDIWRHVDAAYGGFLCSMLKGQGAGLLSEETRGALRAVHAAHSVTIDPHKLGYTPYACGAFLARDQQSYICSNFSAPYLERTDLGSSSWTSTLEGSRPATGAAAVWMTEKSIGLGTDGLGGILASTVLARRIFECRVACQVSEARFIQGADTNIALLTIAKSSEALSESNKITKRVFEYLSTHAGVTVSKTILGPDYKCLRHRHADMYDGVDDDDYLFALRCVFMDPQPAESENKFALADRFSGQLQQAINDARGELK